MSRHKEASDSLGGRLAGECTAGVPLRVNAGPLIGPLRERSEGKFSVKPTTPTMSREQLRVYRKVYVLSLRLQALLKPLSEKSEALILAALNAEIPPERIRILARKGSR
jgi:hypothetical protein